MLASEIMGLSAALLNDKALTVFTYTAQIPFLNMAIAELNETCEQNNVPLSNATSDAIVIPVGIDNIGGGNGAPSLPIGLVEIQQLHERTSETSESYIPMTRVEFLPLYEVLTNNLICWAYENEIIKFIGATSDRQVKIQYVASRINPVTNENNIIPFVNSSTFLFYRTAGLCAEFIGENKTRADDLNGDASLALDRFLGINTKSRQSIMTRRRPFMAGYKRSGGMY